MTNDVPKRICFLPWVTLPDSVEVAGFRFQPINMSEVEHHLPTEHSDRASKIWAEHVDYQGKPVSSLTLILRDGDLPIPEDQTEKAFEAANWLALCCLSEQRFYSKGFRPHMNSAMFRPISVPVTQNYSDVIRRRGESARTLYSGEVQLRYQAPPQVRYTSVADGKLNSKLMQGLVKLRAKPSRLRNRFEASLPIYLMANAEDQTQSLNHWLLLAVMALEAFLEPVERGARVFGKALAHSFQQYPQRRLKEFENRFQIDPQESPSQEQWHWPVRRKWAKELYEFRSTTVHTGHDGSVAGGLSENWCLEQHLVAAAEVYPLLVKVALSEKGLYRLSQSDRAKCDCFDQMLACGWPEGEDTDPEWSSISEDLAVSRMLRKDIKDAFDKCLVDGK